MSNTCGQMVMSAKIRQGGRGCVWGGGGGVCVYGGGVVYLVCWLGKAFQVG